MLNEWEVFLRVLAAALLGGVIGYEREARGHSAGLRTHMLVAAGAALFSATAVLTGQELDGGSAQVQADMTRIAAGVVTGIGFLGAGTIIVRDDRRVGGLTTAAGLWVTAAIGVAAGFGLYVLSALSTLLVALIMLAQHVVERNRHRRDRDRRPPG